jgi:hypothetical protein
VTLRSSVYMGLPPALVHHLWVSDTARHTMILIGMAGCDTNNNTTPAAMLGNSFESIARGCWDRRIPHKGDDSYIDRSVAGCAVGRQTHKKFQPAEWLQTATEPILSLRPLDDVKGPSLVCSTHGVAQSSRN